MRFRSLFRSVVVSSLLFVGTVGVQAQEVDSYGEETSFAELLSYVIDGAALGPTATFSTHDDRKRDSTMGGRLELSLALPRLLGARGWELPAGLEIADGNRPLEGGREPWSRLSFGLRRRLPFSARWSVYPAVGMVISSELPGRPMAFVAGGVECALLRGGGSLFALRLEGRHEENFSRTRMESLGLAVAWRFDDLR